MSDVFAFAADVEEGLIAAVRQIRPLLRRNAPIGEAQRSMTDEVLHTLEQLGMWSLITPPPLGRQGSVIGRVQQNQSRSGQRRSRGRLGRADHQWLYVDCESHVGSPARGTLQSGDPANLQLVRGRGHREAGARRIHRRRQLALQLRMQTVELGTVPRQPAARGRNDRARQLRLHPDDRGRDQRHLVHRGHARNQLGFRGGQEYLRAGASLRLFDKTFGYREPGKKHVGAPSDNWQVFPLIRAAGLGQLVGAVEAALELALEGAQRKPVPNTTYTKQMNSPVVQRNLGEAAAKIDTAALLVDSLCDVQDQAALAGRQFTPLERARQKAGCAITIDLLSTALDKIMFVGGSSAFAHANELQRFWRDFNTAARHAIYLPDFGYEVYGAMRLGINQTAVPPNLV